MNALPSTLRPADLHVWDEAFRRVESYLRAHGIESRVQLNLLTTEIIAAAQRATGEQAGADPVTRAMHEANVRIGGWFSRVLGADPGNEVDERFLAHGRLAMITAEVPTRWPKSFLSDEAAPEELVAAMKACVVQAGPVVRFTNMAPQRIEFSSPGNGGTPLAGSARATMLRAAALWVVIIGLLGVTWAASH